MVNVNRQLADSDPEPPVGSVVLDGNGGAHQRTRGDRVDGWQEAGDEWQRPLSFIITDFGPVTLIYEASEGQQ